MSKRFIGDDNPEYIRMQKSIKLNIQMRVGHCPFCNKMNTATLMPHGEDLWYVICNAVKEGCGAATGRRHDALEVINLWNTRGGILLCEQEEYVKKFLSPPKKKRRKK